MFLLLGLVVVLVLLIAGVYLLLRRRSAVDKSLATYSGPISEYSGDKRLVVAFTASWASTWAVAEIELRKLDFARLDLAVLDQAVDGDEIRAFGITFLPTVALVENGEIVERVQNLTNIEQLAEW